MMRATGGQVLQRTYARVFSAIIEESEAAIS